MCRSFLEKNCVLLCTCICCGIARGCCTAFRPLPYSTVTSIRWQSIGTNFNCSKIVRLGLYNYIEKILVHFSVIPCHISPSEHLMQYFYHWQPPFEVENTVVCTGMNISSVNYMEKITTINNTSSWNVKNQSEKRCWYVWRFDATVSKFVPSTDISRHLFSKWGWFKVLKQWD